MNKAFINIFLINLLIVLELIPAIMLVTAMQTIGWNMTVWGILGISILPIISYIMYKNNKRD